MKWSSIQIRKTCLPTLMLDPKRTPEKPFLYVDISSIDRNLKVITSTLEIIGKDAPSRARKEIYKGDVLVSTVRPNLNAVTIVPSEFDGQIASTGFCVLRPNHSVIDGKYLFYFTLTSDFVDILSSMVRGAHYPAVSDDDVKGLTIPLPTLSEQHRIVEILDQADALRKKRADAKAEKILPALFYKMFGDPVTNSKGWEVIPLGKLSIGKPQYGANAKAIDWKKGKPRYVRITDVENSGSLLSKDIKTVDLHEWNHYKLEYGDLLFARSGATVGKSYLYQPEDGLCVFAGYLIRFKIDFNKIDPFVVFCFTQLPCYEAWVKSKKRTHGQPNINAQEYSSLLIPNPKKELQQAFVKTALEIRKARKMIDQTKIKIELLYTTILNKAFSGNLTAKWRKEHMKELLAEMDQQAKTLM